MTYTHLTDNELFYIEKRLAENIGVSTIARELGRDRSTINREISRNNDESFGFYSGLRANTLALESQKTAKRKSKKISNLSSEIFEKFMSMLKDRTSPDQIRGRIRRENNVNIATSTIYDYIAEDRANGGKLYTFLRHRGKKYRAVSNGSRSRIPNRVSIHNRPEIANLKQAPGHWECDTVYGKDQQSYLLTLTDKATKFEIIRKIPNKEAETIYKEIQNIVATTLLPFETITSDNGTEFSLHESITNTTGAYFYFADSYSSWQRGLNEHHNGLIRDFLPKGSDFRKEDDIVFTQIENNLNNRPRKSLNYLTPVEAMVNYLQSGNMGVHYAG
jgi:transposase, IS30 family